VFAPNRLLTTKEQWLLVGFVVAVITGCATLLLHDKVATEPGNTADTVVITSKPKPPQSSPESTPAVVAPPVTPAVVENETITVVQAPAPPEMIGTAIMGAVRHPDLYMVETGTRAADLIALAGGVTENADLSDILLTAPLVDETTLTIPELPDVTVNDTEVSIRRKNITAAVNPSFYRKSSPVMAAQAAASGQYTSSAVLSTVAPVSGSPSASGALLNINQATSEQLQELPGIGPVFAERIIAERTRQPFMTVDELKRVSGIADKRLEAIRPFITAP
jgi:competence protein ComEA